MTCDWLKLSWVVLCLEISMAYKYAFSVLVNANIVLLMIQIMFLHSLQFKNMYEAQQIDIRGESTFLQL